MTEEKKELKATQIIDKLQSYINGKLITSVFIEYWNKLKEIVKALEDHLYENELSNEEFREILLINYDKD